MINNALKLLPVIALFITLKSSSQQPDFSFQSVENVNRQYAGTKQGASFLVFSEDRENPVKWFDSLNTKWLQPNAGNTFKATASPGEYFIFQLGVYGFDKTLNKVNVQFTTIKNANGNIIAAKQFTCFNQQGIDFAGKPFTKKINVLPNRVQALWVGIDIPANAVGDYQGHLTVSANGQSKIISLQLNITGSKVVDHGFNEGKNLSRLAWLNSTAGLDDNITKGYTPIKKTGSTIHISGRDVTLAATGLPSGINSYFTPSNQSIQTTAQPIINSSFVFIIEKNNGEIIHLQPGVLQFTQQTNSFITWQVNNSSPQLDVLCEGRLEFDGFLSYKLTLTARQALAIKDIRLEVPMDKDKAQYMMGLNAYGGYRPAKWDWNWDTAKNQDMLWLGNVNGGLRFKWKAENYTRPLVNIYYSFGPLHLPPSWGNEGRGGVHVSEKNNKVLVNAYSGSRSLQKSEVLNYDFEVLITPFKVMDKNVQYGDRYFHSDKDVATNFIKEANEHGANIINVHHKKDIYPFINYPYSDENVAGLKSFIQQGHADNKRVKVYYTTRELTSNLPELWAFKSLGDEVIFPGPGNSSKTLIHPDGPHQWLKDNLRENYLPAWVASFTEGPFAGRLDLSVITTPDSRINNFYIAGLNWMTKNLKIDGVYIDDVAMDRTTIRRARKILDDNRPKARIDLHSWNHFNEWARYANSLNLYMDLLPYIDQVWIGESRDYNLPPDNWLVEVCGIPYGLPGQMLEGGGNPWRGMLYGITTRAGWTKNPPDYLWQFWDTYKIKDKEMIGYWDKNSPVKFNNDSIKVTVFKGVKQSIISIGSWSKYNEKGKLNIDWKALGLDASKAIITAPAIKDFQPAKTFAVDEEIEIESGKGWLLVISN